MNVSLLSLEIGVVLLGVALLVADWFTPAEFKRRLGVVAAAVLLLMAGYSFCLSATTPQFAFGQSYVLDDLALFFKRFFLVAGVLVLLWAVEFSDRLRGGVVEFYALLLFALAGMMFTASANNLAMLFVALELVTITFYVLAAYQRQVRESLEAGVKYLIMGGLASAFMVFGIALIFGVTGTIEFEILRAKMAVKNGPAEQPLFQLGMLMLLAGLGFKIAAVPFQIWVPDVYQGAPSPVTAFLAAGSKAAGFALVVRLFMQVTPLGSLGWETLMMAVAGVTLLYGNLCAIPQRNVKRLLGYSSIAHAGYLLLGVAAASLAGVTAVLYYLSGYLFTVLAAFGVITLVLREAGAEDIGALSGLGRRSPFLAATMTLAMVSLAGVPPLAGFFGKFLLIKAVLQAGAQSSAYYWLAGVAVVGVVISLWYYFGVIKAMYWGEDAADMSPVAVSLPSRVGLVVCLAGMLWLGLMPEVPLWLAEQGAMALGW
ncbi:MAG: NADH-quinone oxidoreductase subunit N [Verrucomicrobiae bacterium]|nr:NADH-quinone oxidoreductase subunit N [Verrucomicrobiae bacterium]